MTKKLPILFKEARTGKLHSWEIWTEGSDMVEEYGTVDGAKTTNRRTCEGKNIGKANETTPEEQAVLEAAAKHTKKLKKGYSKSKAGAKEVVFLPMLAKDYRKLKKPLKFPVDAQPKLDGVRCTVFWEDGKIRLMSRGGENYSVAHISESIAEFLPSDSILDGELYIHGMPLQDINKLVKKHREVGDKECPGGSIELEYWIFDGFHKECTNHPWSRRRDDLTKLLKTFKDKKLVTVPTTSCKNVTELSAFLDAMIEQGYEGTIIRKLDGEYNLGHRSSDLLKWKKFIDAEFEIVGYYEAKGNDKGTVCWTCATKDGKEFRVRPMGTRERRAEMLQNADDYLGKMLTVKFQQYSKDGIPTGNTVGKTIRDPGT